MHTSPASAQLRRSAPAPEQPGSANTFLPRSIRPSAAQHRQCSAPAHSQSPTRSASPSRRVRSQPAPATAAPRPVPSPSPLPTSAATAPHPPIHNPRRGPHLRLDVFVLTLRPRRQHRGQFLLRRLPPCRLLRRQVRTHSQQQHSARKGPSCNSCVHHFGFLRDSHGRSEERIAAVAACVRSVTPSLLSRLLMWVFTVASEIASSVAISLLLLPFTICSSTSASRGVRSSVPMRSASFSAMAGGMCALPA